jgi:hypothetical protein
MSLSTAGWKGVIALAAGIVVSLPPAARAVEGEQPAVVAPDDAPSHPVGVITPAQATTAPQNGAIYDRSHIGFTDVIETNRQGKIHTIWGTPYEGGEHRRLTVGDFYDKVGRPDLVQRYRRRWRLSWGLIGSGLVLVGALTAAVVGSIATQQSSEEVLTIWLVAGTAGVGSIVAGACVDVDPLPRAQSRALADEYNRNLRTRLGIGGRF